MVDKKLAKLVSSLSLKKGAGGGGSGCSGADWEVDDEGFIILEHHLDEISGKIMNRPETDRPMICDCYEYLKAVDDIQKLTGYLESYKSSSPSPSPSPNVTPLLGMANFVLGTAMSSLRDEFRHLLLKNRKNIVNPDVLSDLKSIVNMMFESKYGPDCWQVFVDIRRDALNDCLVDLHVEKMGIEDVLKAEWELGRWMQAMDLLVHVHLPAEKMLTEQVFGDLESVGPDCFVELSKPAVFQLLSFDKDVRAHNPEKLLQILNMYELLEDLLPDIINLYDEPWVRSECLDVLMRLGESAKETYLKFEFSVATNASPKAQAGGGVHHLTRYVMNYMKPLMDHKGILDKILDSKFSKHVKYLVLVLEHNLEHNSHMYEEKAQRHIFLMNNEHFIVEKVENSEQLRAVLGDGWIKDRIQRFQQHAVSYERATWRSVLGFLSCVGMRNADSVSPAILKERLQMFYREFERVYKSQTGWLVPEEQLRNELRISVSIKVIQAYTSFVGRHMKSLKMEKHIKYSIDDISGYLLDLFEGTQKSLCKK